MYPAFSANAATTRLAFQATLSITNDHAESARDEGLQDQLILPDETLKEGLTDMLNAYARPRTDHAAIEAIATDLSRAQEKMLSAKSEFIDKWGPPVLEQ